MTFTLSLVDSLSLLLTSLLLLAAPARASHLFARFDHDTPLGARSAYKRHPITVAQLEDQSRRPEVQAGAGKGAMAVPNPNVLERVRSYRQPRTFDVIYPEP